MINESKGRGEVVLRPLLQWSRFSNEFLFAFLRDGMLRHILPYPLLQGGTDAVVENNPAVIRRNVRIHIFPGYLIRGENIAVQLHPVHHGVVMVLLLGIHNDHAVKIAETVLVSSDVGTVYQQRPGMVFLP